MDDPKLKEIISHLPYKVVAGNGNRPKIEVAYMNEDIEFSPVELTAILLKNLKKLAEL